jgi:hypothetical protein
MKTSRLWSCYLGLRRLVSADGLHEPATDASQSDMEKFRLSDSVFSVAEGRQSPVSLMALSPHSFRFATRRRQYAFC